MTRIEQLCVDKGLRMTEQRRVIARVLSESGGNRSLAARTLGLHRATLHGKLRAQDAALRAG